MEASHRHPSTDSPWVIITTVLITISMVIGTFLQKVHGENYAQEHIYHSAWFVALWGLLLVVSGLTLFKRRLYCRPATFALHCALGLIVSGMILTQFTSQSGHIWLTPHAPVAEYESARNGESSPLPFTVMLDTFYTACYPGTQAPQDYISRVAFSESDGNRTTVEISMNRIGRYGGWRFCQSGMDNEGNVKLKVAHDPLGIAVNYAGYLLLLLSMAAFFFEPHSQWRTLLTQLRESRNAKKALTALVLPIMLLGGIGAAEARAVPHTLPKSTASKMGDMYVMYNDRICPLQTLATDFTTKLYGKPTYHGLTAEQVFSGWLFWFSEWAEEPMIKIKGKVTREALGTEGRYARLSDFYDPYGELKLERMTTGLALDDSRRGKLMAADEKYNLITMLYSGKLLNLFPITDSTDGRIAWYSQQSDLPASTDPDIYLFVRHHLSLCQEMAIRGDWEGLETVFEKTRRFQLQNAVDGIPRDFTFKAEQVLDSISSLRIPAMLYMTIGLLFFALYIIQLTSGRHLPKALQLTGRAMLGISTLYLALLFILRWVVTGYIPMTSGYETMIFLGLCASAISLTLQFRQPFLLPCGLLLTGLTMMVAMMGGASPTVTQLMPVLSSPLLCIHVAIIMLAYTLLAFVMLNGLAALLANIRRRYDDKEAEALSSATMERSRMLSLIMLYPAVFCLAIGIFVGAVWANISWGTYWSWDPKEVWALITMMAYSLPLHGQLFAWLRKPRAFHIYTVLAFLTVLFTYFGVNYLLGGMHSYT